MYTENVEIPEGVTIDAKKSTAKVKGKNGELERKFNKKVNIKVNGKSVEIISEEKALVGTVRTHIKNMVVGVMEGHEKKMKINYAHFPMSVEVKGKVIIIKNFIGEKSPRMVKVVGDTKVQVKGQEITITGSDKDAVGQTAANLVTGTRIRNKDSRIFQDGIYLLNE